VWSWKTRHVVGENPTESASEAQGRGSQGSHGGTLQPGRHDRKGFSAERQLGSRNWMGEDQGARGKQATGSKRSSARPLPGWHPAPWHSGAADHPLHVGSGKRGPQGLGGEPAGDGWGEAGESKRRRAGVAVNSEGPSGRTAVLLALGGARAPGHQECSR